MYVIKLKTLIIYAVIVSTIIIGLNCLQHDSIAVSEQAVPAEAAESVQLPAIMYHGITKERSRVSKYVISYDMFEADLKYIQANGYTTVLIQDLINYVDGTGDLPEKPILLTFDDGYYNNYTYGFELLKQYDMKAIISIIGRWTDLYSQTGENNPNYSHLTWENISEMMDSGLVEIQNHSYDMHTIDKGRNGTKKNKNEGVQTYAKILTEDIGKLQQEMRDQTGYTPTCFAYPYGGISDASYQVIKDMGFRSSLSCEENMNTITRGDKDCLYKLSRYLRSNTESVEKILKRK